MSVLWTSWQGKGSYTLLMRTSSIGSINSLAGKIWSGILLFPLWYLKVCRTQPSYQIQTVKFRTVNTPRVNTPVLNHLPLLQKNLFKAAFQYFSRKVARRQHSVFTVDFHAKQPPVLSTLTCCLGDTGSDEDIVYCRLNYLKVCRVKSFPAMKSSIRPLILYQCILISM